jgi:hypothetical protein
MQDNIYIEEALRVPLSVDIVLLLEHSEMQLLTSQRISNRSLTNSREFKKFNKQIVSISFREIKKMVRTLQTSKSDILGIGMEHHLRLISIQNSPNSLSILF